ncbi:MAG TPA: multicopper oxidase domain-containing protein [Nitrososphaeraceae archaeon]
MNCVLGDFGILIAVILYLLFLGVQGSYSLMLPAAESAESTGLQSQVDRFPMATTKRVLLFAHDAIVQVAPDSQLKPGGVLYHAMTFNGTIPGPLISINQGDILEITLVNQADGVHSLDFHAGYGPSQALSGSVEPGANKTWTMRVDYPGVFMYHCDGDNLNGIWEHMASGMYGEIVVHSLNESHARDFYMVFSELYNSADTGLFKGTNGKIGSFSIDKFIADRPDLILTNGMAYKYIPFFGGQTKLPVNENSEVFKVKTGELTRWYVVNAGPRDYLAFNFAGGLINNNLATGKNLTGSSASKIYETIIAPGAGAGLDVIFPEEGTYFGNDHDMGHLLMGGGFVVVASSNSINEG